MYRHGGKAWLLKARTDTDIWVSLISLLFLHFKEHSKEIQNSTYLPLSAPSVPGD